MLKTDQEIDELLGHKNNGVNKVQVKIIGSGNHGNQSSDSKHKGNQDRDPESHATIGTLAHLIGNKETSELLGVHPASVSKYSRGLNSNNEVDPILMNSLEKKLDNVNEKVVKKIDKLIEIFNEDVMANLKPAEIPSSAEKLVNIFDKIKRRNENNASNTMKPQVILFAPKQINVEQLITKEV